jgi:hypothetical protein
LLPHDSLALLPKVFQSLWFRGHWFQSFSLQTPEERSLRLTHVRKSSLKRSIRTQNGRSDALQKVINSHQRMQGIAAISHIWRN